MKRPWRRVISVILIVGAVCGAAGAQPGRAREPIGQVLGRPVFRDQIEGDRLQEVFLNPIMERYFKEHEAEVKPTASETRAMREFSRRRHEVQMAKEGPRLRAELARVESELAALGRKKTLTPAEQERRDRLESLKVARQCDLRPDDGQVGLILLRGWKFNRHLYETYGGGRVLWQQTGVEAFDAMRRFLEEQERRGAFVITDPEVRARLFAYWTKDQPGLESSPERIRKLLLAPEWLPPEIAGASGAGVAMGGSGEKPSAPEPEPEPTPVAADPRRACFGNQRLLEGAIEMYNMDHDATITAITPELYAPDGILVQQGYLKPLEMPSAGCRFRSEGDLTEAGSRITCDEHGSVSGQ